MEENQKLRRDSKPTPCTEEVGDDLDKTLKERSEQQELAAHKNESTGVVIEEAQQQQPEKMTAVERLEQEI